MASLSEIGSDKHWVKSKLSILSPHRKIFSGGRWPPRVRKKSLTAAFGYEF
ncbi:hypothetical protein ENTCAN_08491 [Enterobacter cancerogenus ATCC 35316]|nr:hypothetical protein ENTCAN_08491 [Enterobacter cancerogenus ATCC 35316]